LPIAASGTGKGDIGQKNRARHCVVHWWFRGGRQRRRAASSPVTARDGDAADTVS
jgi:hypothetical protein